MPVVRDHVNEYRLGILKARELVASANAEEFAISTPIASAAARFVAGGNMPKSPNIRSAL